MNERDMYMLRRKKKKISQAKIAKVIGVSQSLISRYENGECDMSQRYIEKYIEYIENYK